MAFEDQLRPADFDADHPRDLGLALRRHTDRCFFEIEELVPHPDGRLRGFVVAGHLIDPDDVAELRRQGEPASDPGRCPHD